MDSNIEFLNYIYQNAEMGKNTISQLIGIVDDSVFKQKLDSQLKEYNEIYDIVYNKIEQSHETAKGIGAFPKFTTHLMININTTKNKTPSHIAEMMIQGSTMGIIDITKKINEYKNTDKDILAVADRLLKLEQQNVDEMKMFLQ